MEPDEFDECSRCEKPLHTIEVQINHDAEQTDNIEDLKRCLDRIGYETFYFGAACWKSLDIKYELVEED